MNVVNEIYPADPAAVFAGDVTFLALGHRTAGLKGQLNIETVAPADWSADPQSR